MLAPVQLARRIKLSLMVIGSYNPRRHSGLQKESLESLADGIKATGGFIQMPLLRPISIDGIEMFEVVAGQRRIKAARIAFGEDAEVDVMVREMTDLEARVAAAVENIDRENMSPPEEAEAAARVLAELDGDRAATAKQMGWSLAVLDDRLKLMSCSDLVRDRLATKAIGLGIAELLAGLPKSKQDELIGGFDAQGKVPTIDEFRSQIMVLTKSLDGAIFAMEDCAACPHNSAQQSAMFTTGIEKGHCLNAACYDQKSEQALQAKVDSLRDTYPTVRIVRPGEQYRIQKLTADGQFGVGKEQAELCRTCKDFGVAVSGVPDKLGRVSGSLCFNVKCNEEKVRDRIAAEKAEAAAAAASAHAETDSAGADHADAAGEGAAEATPEAAKGTTKAAKPTQKVKPAAGRGKPAAKPTVTLSSSVLAYRDQLYSTVVATETLKSPARGLGLLMALACAKRLSAVDSEQCMNVLQKLMPGDSTAVAASLGERFTDVMSCREDRVAHFVARIAATSASALTGQECASLVRAFDPDWSEHFTLDVTFLALLTKSEIEAVAQELGIDKALGDAAKGLYTKKKDEIIKTVLGLPDFQYRGAMPKVLKPESSRN